MNATTQPNAENPADGRSASNGELGLTPLLPCPFCGADGETIDTHGWLDGDGNYGPQCLECGATAESAEKWNWRVEHTEA